MRGPKPSCGAPDAELLAAYLDGEFEGRDGLDDLRRHVEAWLENNPAASDLVRDYRQLRHAWNATTPREPGRDVWQRMLSRVKEGTRTPARQARRRWTVAALAGCAAAALLITIGLQVLTPSTQPFDPPARQVETHEGGSGEDDYVLPVARADEITILEGGDRVTVAVAQLYQPFELASAEEVTIDSMETAAEDNMVSTVRFGARSPMIWAIAKTE